jgi:hypothetical protein
MADDNAVVANEDVFDDEAYDALALDDVKCICSAAQSGEERCECLGKAQERSPVGSLISKGLHLGA